MPWKGSAPFGELLATWRQRRHLTQTALAQALGAHRNTIGRWERGEGLPETRGMVLELARLLRLEEWETRQLLEASLTALVPYWTVPHHRNPAFTGRDALLQHLQTCLAPTQPGAHTQAVALCGLGGIGKTQLAVEYAYRTALEYTAVFWLAAETAESLMTSVEQIAEHLQLPERQAIDQSQVVVAVGRWLVRHPGWLVIADNVEDPARLQAVLPATRHGALLLTTRQQTLGTLAEALDVPPLSREEGTQLLLARAHRDGLSLSRMEETATAEVVTLLEGLPLALDQAGAYLDETHCSISGYLRRYQQQRSLVLARRGQHGGAHPASVTTTLLLSVQHIEQEHPAVGELLHFCAFLHPEAIPEELLSTEMAKVGSAPGRQGMDAYHFDLALAALRSASLIVRDPQTQTLSIHRLVQAVLQDQMEPATVRLWGERVIRMVNAAFPEVTHEAWKPCERLLPHALTCATLLPDAVCDLELAELLRKAGEYLSQRGQYNQAASLLQRVLRMQEQLFGPEDPQRTHTLYNLGLLSHKQGKREQAEELLQCALSIREQALGANHLEVARSLNALADLYREQDQHEHAESLYLRTLQIREQAPGGAQAEVAVTLGNLATLYRDQGKYEQAEPLYQQALRLQEQAGGAAHPDFARLLNNLALLYYHQGNYEQAEPLYQRALQIREQVLGPDHPDVTRPLNNLALLYYHQGNYAQAEPLYQRMLCILEQALGPDHPDTASALNGLATLSHDQGKYEQAEAFYLRALQVREQALGSSHSALSRPLYNLGKLYREQGKYAQAEPFFRRALSVVEQALGPEHPDVAFPLDGLANLYRDQHQYEQASACYQRALHLREQHLGPAHPRTAETLCNLGTLCLKQERYEQAEALFQRSLLALEQALGREHPDLVSPLRGLAELCRHQQRDEQAEAFYQRAFTISEHRLGPDHPQTGEIQKEYQNFLSERSQASETATRHQADVPSLRDPVLDAVKETPAIQKQGTDPLYAFLVTCCEQHPHAWCRASELWYAYQRWGKEQQEPFSLSRRALTAALKARGYRADRTNTARLWRGIALVHKP